MSEYKYQVGFIGAAGSGVATAIFKNREAAEDLLDLWVKTNPKSTKETALLDFRDDSGARHVLAMNGILAARLVSEEAVVVSAEHNEYFRSINTNPVGFKK